MTQEQFSNLTQRLDDVVAEPDLYKRQQEARRFRLWIAAQLSPWTQKADTPPTAA